VRQIIHIRALSAALVLALTLALLGQGPRVAAAQSSNGVIHPPAGGVVRGALTVVAVADHPDFRKWQLDMLVWGDAAQAHFLGVGEDAQPNPIALQTIDSTLFPDGEHLLRLRVVREDQNYDEYLTPIVIANQAPVARAASGLGAMSALSRVGQLVVACGCAHCNGDGNSRAGAQFGAGAGGRASSSCRRAGGRPIRWPQMDRGEHQQPDADGVGRQSALFADECEHRQNRLAHVAGHLLHLSQV
jgi:hypothetical protein